jgi:hypothetical protein
MPVYKGMKYYVPSTTNGLGFRPNVTLSRPSGNVPGTLGA